MVMRVLVVDDSRAMRRIMRQALVFAGVPEDAVFEAGHGRDALTLVREAPPTLVLSDVHMPEMDGCALLDAMREEGRLDASPVVMVTSAVGASSALELVRRGATKVVRKPFDPLSLHAQIEEFLDVDEDDEEVDDVGAEPASAAEDRQPALLDAAVDAVRGVLTRSLAEASTMAAGELPVGRILVEAGIEVHDPDVRMVLRCDYEVATRIALGLVGEEPTDDLERLDALAELANMACGVFVDAVVEGGATPGSFGLPASGVGLARSPREVAKVELMDPAGAIFVELEGGRA